MLVMERIGFHVDSRDGFSKAGHCCGLVLRLMRMG